MLILLWFKGLFQVGRGRLLGATLGVALCVALLALLGAFIVSSGATMTARAITDVPVDWQVQLHTGTDAAAARSALGQATAYTALQTVDYATVSGLTVTSGTTTQTTGAGKVLGIDTQYPATFPGEIRLLTGTLNGVLIAQQTAANLHASVGDTVTIQRLGLPPASITVNGVVDLPNADSLFQAAEVLPNAAPQAPPDNVLLLPAAQWHLLFDPQGSGRPDSVQTQFHVRIAHDLPTDPAAAYIQVQQQARNFEARIAGSGIVSDNLAARLNGVRADALYARVLFLFLGAPGVILAAVLTLAVAATGVQRRDAEQALLRTRGASLPTVIRLESAEAVVIGTGGALLGALIALIVGRAMMLPSPLTTAGAGRWVAIAVGAGLLLAVVAVTGPVWTAARRSTVAGARAVIGRGYRPLWQRVALDFVLLAASAVAFWQTASSGYQVVVAPESVAQTAVSYQTFIAPLCLWLGIGLLAMRLSALGLARGRHVLAGVFRPVAAELAGVVAAALGRERARIARGIVLVALAFSFAVATAIFNTTYDTQARVDAQLTNGADVTVSGTTAAAPGGQLPVLAALPGVVGIQPMQHRYAYVGNDLQDLYGIDPRTIGQATSMADAYFANGDARATLAALAAQPDGVLVSAETVKDYQLHAGDRINLRLQGGSDHQYRVVPFQFIGVVREFPTAPKDSFLVGNAAYIAAQTGVPTAEIVLMRTNADPAALADRVRIVVQSLPGAQVTDLGTTRYRISSSLTAVNLRGLTQLELAFAILLIAGATGLVIALGMVERRRTYAVLVALGATTRQVGAFVWSEGLLILIGGAIVGVATGVAVAAMLVKVLTGVFDPPPEALAVPWGYLGVLVVAAIISTAIAILTAEGSARRSVSETVRSDQ